MEVKSQYYITRKEFLKISEDLNLGIDYIAFFKILSLNRAALRIIKSKRVSAYHIRDILDLLINRMKFSRTTAWKNWIKATIPIFKEIVPEDKHDSYKVNVLQAANTINNVNKLINMTHLYSSLDGHNIRMLFREIKRKGNPGIISKVTIKTKSYFSCNRVHYTLIDLIKFAESRKEYHSKNLKTDHSIGIYTAWSKVASALLKAKTIEVFENSTDTWELEAISFKKAEKVKKLKIDTKIKYVDSMKFYKNKFREYWKSEEGQCSLRK